MILENTDNTSANLQQTSVFSTHHDSPKLIPAIIGLVCLALVIILSFIGTSSRKGPMFDQQRLSDFSNLQTAIKNFYTTRGYIPENLDTFSNKDPETKLPYDYKPLSDYSYQLCATFSTEKTTKTDHKKGYDCITYEIDESDKPEPFVFIKPKNDEELCLSQLYTIDWEVDHNVSQIVSLSLFPQGVANLVNENSWQTLSQSQFLSPGQPINPNKPNSRLKGSFIWKVGDVLNNSTVKRITDLFPTNYYHWRATIINNGILQNYDGYNSGFITISNCSKN